MKITITSSTGHGVSRLAAFDAALSAANLERFNLIAMSSIIPAHVDVRVAERYDGPGELGDRMYVVQSVKYAVEPGRLAVAALGWLHEPGRGGFFIENNGEDPAEIRQSLSASLDEMNTRRGIEAEPKFALAEVEAGDRPACAIVIAAYQPEGWE
jgi:arginine decarboxylase